MHKTLQYPKLWLLSDPQPPNTFNIQNFPFFQTHNHQTLQYPKVFVSFRPTEKMAVYSASKSSVDLAIDPLITCRLCLMECPLLEMYELHDCKCLYCEAVCTCASWQNSASGIFLVSCYHSVILQLFSTTSTTTILNLSKRTLECSEKICTVL